MAKERKFEKLVLSLEASHFNMVPIYDSDGGEWGDILCRPCFPISTFRHSIPLDFSSQVSVCLPHMMSQ